MNEVTPGSATEAETTGARAGVVGAPATGTPTALPREESLGQILRSLRDDTQKLVRNEMQLVRAELREKSDALRRHAVWLGIGIALLIAAGIELLFALNRGLSAWFAEGMSARIAIWLVPLLVGAILFAAGLIFVRHGKQGIKEATTAPEHTTHTMEKDRRFVRDQVRHRT